MNCIRYKHLTDVLSAHPSITMGTLIAEPNVCLSGSAINDVNAIDSIIKGSSQHKVGGEWFEIKLGKISRMLVKYEVLPIPNVIFVC